MMTAAGLLRSITVATASPELWIGMADKNDGLAEAPFSVEQPMAVHTVRRGLFRSGWCRRW